MAQKKSPAELKAEADAISAHIALARKRPLNFALLIGKEGLVLEAHMTKGPDVMRRAAKAAGGGPKGAMGVMNVSGKVMELTCVDEDAPRNLTKLAKKFFAERGITMKVVMLLPGGERVGEEDDDGDSDTDDVKDDAPEDSNEASTEKLVDDVKEALKARLTALVPQVRGIAAKNAALAEKLGKGLKAAASELQSDAHDKAAKLLDALEKAIADAAKAGPDPEAVRARLQQEYADAKGSLEKLKANASKAVGGKAAQLSSMFEGLVSGEDLKKAGAVLSLLKTFVQSETAKLAENTGSVFEKIGDAVGEFAEGVGEALEDAKEMAEDFVESLTPAGRAKQSLERLGFSEAEAEKIAADLEKNPNAVKEAKAKLVDDAKLDPTQTAMLKKLADSDPKSFEAAMNTLKSMDADGKDDISPANMQASLDALEAARKASVAALADQRKADQAQRNAAKAIVDSGGAFTKAQGEVTLAAANLAKFQVAMPADLSKLTEAERQTLVKESNRLININEDAKKALDKAKKDQEAAAKAKVDADKARGDADKKVTDAKGPLDAAIVEQEKLAAKKGMLDALSLGRLSPDAKPPFKDEDKASFIAAFGKDSRMATAAMDMAAGSPNPSAVAQNVGLIADKMKDGFAAADGRKLDLPEDDLRTMSMNALQIGSLQGEGYFKGFDEYLKTGAQLKPDPNGGMAKPLSNPPDETKRRNAINLKRASSMGAAAVGPDGKVNFESDGAKAAMDHMMFHPGSLTTFDPQMTQKMAETKELFSNSKTKDKADKVIADTKLPTTGAGKSAAMTIVSGTMGKSKDTLNDNDAKGAVLSAMMTPLSQGPVGSCFSTAPVRNIRETDPIRAMGEFSKLASTGVFKTAQNKEYLANQAPPQGENPLMRSWEYSAATAAAELADSVYRNRVQNSIMPNPPNGTSMGDIKGLVGAGKWNDKIDPVKGIVPGVRGKLDAALRNELKFEYNAGPKLDVAGGGGGGDGKSTDGRYNIIYKGKAVTSENDFIAALVEIGLKAAGETKTSAVGQSIVSLIDEATFRSNIIARFGDGKAPWDMPDGGFASETDRVLNGGTPTTTTIVGANKPPAPVKSRTDRSADVLGFVLGKAGPNKDMSVISTFGDNCNHSFNATPNHPSMDKIRDPNSAQKIKSELIDPGKAIATTALPKDEAAKAYTDALRSLDAGADPAGKLALAEALKRGPTAPMTPAQLETKIKTELAAYRDALGLAKAEAYFAEKLPNPTPTQRTNVEKFFKDRATEKVDAKALNAVISVVELPQVTIADTNWGGSASQTLFVMAPDPRTGDLVLWEKDAVTGEMKLAGKNWEDARWCNVD